MQAEILVPARLMLFLLPVLCLIQERGGIMSLTEVYCLVNRARGLEVRNLFYEMHFSDKVTKEKEEKLLTLLI